MSAMEIISVLNDYSGGLLAVLIISATAGWLGQRRRLDRIETTVEYTNKKLDDPVTGMVPRVEYEYHRDEVRTRLNKLNG